jgi:hypothetical protein
MGKPARPAFWDARLARTALAGPGNGNPDGTFNGLPPGLRPLGVRVPVACGVGRPCDCGWEAVSAMFVTPYPPGSPILKPGRTVTPEIGAHMSALTRIRE